MGVFNDPASKVTNITASDSTDLTGVRELRIGGAGNLSIRSIAQPGTTVTFAVTAGERVPVRVTRVMAATTATGIVGYGD